MGRYVSIFSLTILITVGLFIAIPMLIGNIIGEMEKIVGTILVLLGSFIITQLFYIIDILKKKS